MFAQLECVHTKHGAEVSSAAGVEDLHPASLQRRRNHRGKRSRPDRANLPVLSSMTQFPPLPFQAVSRVAEPPLLPISKKRVEAPVLSVVRGVNGCSYMMTTVQKASYTKTCARFSLTSSTGPVPLAIVPTPTLTKPSRRRRSTVPVTPKIKSRLSVPLRRRTLIIRRAIPRPTPSTLSTGFSIVSPSVALKSASVAPSHSVTPTPVEAVHLMPLWLAFVSMPFTPSVAA